MSPRNLRDSVVRPVVVVVVVLIVVGAALIVDSMRETESEALARCRREAAEMGDVQYVRVERGDRGWVCQFGVGSP